MVAKNNDMPEMTPEQIMETLFTPENLHNLREQHKRYARIQEAKGLKDEIGVIGYFNTIAILGFGVAAMRLISEENELNL